MVESKIYATQKNAEGAFQSIIEFTENSTILEFRNNKYFTVVLGLFRGPRLMHWKPLRPYFILSKIYATT